MQCFSCSHFDLLYRMGVWGVKSDPLVFTSRYLPRNFRCQMHCASEVDHSLAGIRSTGVRQRSFSQELSWLFWPLSTGKEVAAPRQSFWTRCGNGQDGFDDVRKPQRSMCDSQPTCRVTSKQSAARHILVGHHIGSSATLGQRVLHDHPNVWSQVIHSILIDGKG